MPKHEVDPFAKFLEVPGEAETGASALYDVSIVFAEVELD